MKKITFLIAFGPNWYGDESDESAEVTGYQLTPNFACWKSESHLHSFAPWSLTHLGSGYAVFWHRTAKACLADAEKLEQATTPDGRRFHWETISRGNADRRMRRLGAKGMSRILGRDVSVREVRG